MLPRSSKLCTPTAGDWVLKPATRSTASWSLKSPLRVQRWIKIGKRNCSHLLLLPHPGWSLLAGFMSTAVPGYLSHMQNINIYNTFFQTLVCMSKLSLSLSSLITEAFWPLRRTFGGGCFMRHLVSCPTHWQTSSSCNCIPKICLERKYSLLFWRCICFDFCLSLGLVNVVETCLILNVISFCIGSYLSVIFACPSGIAAGHQGLHLWFSCPN